MAYSVSIPLLPRGFTFSPSDDEVVVKYLRPRAANLPVPCPVIVDVEIMRHSPWDLVPEGSMEKYFFAQKELKYKVGTRRNRVTSMGYWRGTGTEVPIYTTNDANQEVVGMKRSLVFYRGNAPNGERTGWAMHEYCLAGTGLGPFRVMRHAATGANNQDPHCRSAAVAIPKKEHVPAPSIQAAQAHNALAPVMVNPDESWVVCRVYKKKQHMRRPIAHAANAWGYRAAYIDYMREANRELSPAASSTTDTFSNNENNVNGNKEVMDVNDN